MTTPTTEMKKALTQVDRSTKSLTAAQTALTKAAEDTAASLASNIALLAQTTQDLEFKQSELTNLGQELTAKERENAAELALRVKENEDKVLTTLMTARKLATITAVDLALLDKEVVALRKGQETELAAAVKATKEAAEADKTAALQTQTLQNNTIIAEYKAKAINDNSKIEFLEQQIVALRKDAEDNRKAQVEIEQARAKSAGVTIQNSK